MLTLKQKNNSGFLPVWIFFVLSGSKTSHFQGLHSLIDYYFFVMYLLCTLKKLDNYTNFMKVIMLAKRYFLKVLTKFLFNSFSTSNFVALVYIVKIIYKLNYLTEFAKKNKNYFYKIMLCLSKQLS